VCSNDKKYFEIGVKLAQLYHSEKHYELAVSCCERLMISSEWAGSDQLPVFHIIAAALTRVGNVSETQLLLVSTMSGINRESLLLSVIILYYEQY